MLLDLCVSLCLFGIQVRVKEQFKKLILLSFQFNTRLWVKISTEAGEWRSCKMINRIEFSKSHRRYV